MKFRVNQFIDNDEFVSISYIYSQQISMHSITSPIFESFLRQYYAGFCYFANRFVKDFATAEDIVAEISLKVWEKRDTLANSAVLKNYFYTSIRNACLRHLDSTERKALIAKEIPTGQNSEQTMLDNIIRTEIMNEIEMAIANLPPACRKVIDKIYVQGKSVAEAAKELKLSKSTIKTQKQRGLISLRNKLLPPGALLYFILLFPH